MIPVRPPDPPTEVRPEWLELLDRLPIAGSLVIIGASDTGKTTIAWWLAGQLAQRPGGAAIVDADVGQSRIGPPASVGWQRIGTTDYEFYFVGATSPERRPSSAFTATMRACGAAESAAAWTVLDTTGYLSGDLAVAYKTAKIKRLRPCHVLAIGDTPDTARVLTPWADDNQVTIHHIPRPPAAKVRSPGERSKWRRECFAPWLRGANLRWLEPDDVEYRNAPDAELFAQNPALARDLRGLLLGFSREDERGLCVGLVHAYDFATDRLLALCPEEAEGAGIIDFGCIRLEADGSQIPATR